MSNHSSESTLPPEGQHASITGVRLNPRKVCLLLAIIALGFSLISLLTQMLVYQAGSARANWFIPLIDVDHELSLPSIYSTLLYGAIGILLILISRMKFNENDCYRWHWLFLSLIFSFLCFDEGASIHELSSAPMEMLVGESGLPGIRQYAWVIPGVILVLAVAIAYWKFLISLPRHIKKWLAIAGLIYFGGLLGMETLGSIYAGTHGAKNITYNVLVTLEEFMEMSGLVLIFYGLLNYVKTTYETLRFRLQ